MNAHPPHTQPCSCRTPLQSTIRRFNTLISNPSRRPPSSFVLQPTHTGYSAHTAQFSISQSQQSCWFIVVVVVADKLSPWIKINFSPFVCLVCTGGNRFQFFYHFNFFIISIIFVLKSPYFVRLFHHFHIINLRVCLFWIISYHSLI